MIASKQLDEWEALASAATAGPWTVKPEHEEQDHGHGMVGNLEIARIEGEHEDYDGSEEAAGNLERRLAADFAFIAASRMIVPALVAEVRKLGAIAEAAQWLIDHMEPGTGPFPIHTDRLREALAAYRAPCGCKSEGGHCGDTCGSLTCKEVSCGCRCHAAPGPDTSGGAK